MIKHEAAPEVSDRVVVLPSEDDASVVDLIREKPRFERLAGERPQPDTSRHYRLLGAGLAVIDVVCLAIALFVAHWIRFGVSPNRGYVLGMAVSVVLWVGVFHALGLYAPQHLSGLDEFRRTVSAVGIGVVLIILLTFWFDVYLSRSWVGLTLVIALVLEVAARRVVRARERRLHARGDLVLRTIIVGSRYPTSEPKALDLRGAWFVPVGFIDTSNPLIASDELSPSETVARLRLLMRDRHPDCILVTSPTIGERQMVAVMRAARLEGAVVRVYTHLTGIFASRLTALQVGRSGLVLTVKPAGLTPAQRVLKRGMDVTLGGIALLVLSPLMLFTAVAIKATSPGPALFRQDRVARGGRLFQIYKFRTMTHEDHRSPDEHAIDTTVPFYKSKTDPRLTPLGRWLRKLSIDELPQLLNVLEGDMSLVGPRPLAAEQVSTDWDLLGPRHEVRPGITGWWQTRGRSDVRPESAVRMDQFYIENWSPFLDLYILLRTIGVLLSGKGAY